MAPARLIVLSMFAALAAGPALAAAPAPAQNQPRELSPEVKADSDGLRALAAATPALPMDRVELKLNPPMVLGNITAMAADKAGNIFIFHRPEDAKVDTVVVIDAKGKFLRSFGMGMNTMPHGIRIDPAGNVWTVDARTSMVYKFSPEGKKLLEITVGDIPDPDRAFCSATDTTFGKNGEVYVSDGYCNARVLEYAADGKKVKEWGKKGTGPGEFNNAHDIAMGPDDTLYVADRENGRLQWFDKSGKYLGQKHFGGQLFSVAINAAGDLYVGAHARGVGFEADSYIFKFDPKSGRILGKLDGFAHQINIAADGTLLPGPVTVKIGNDPSTTTVLMFRPRK